MATTRENLRCHVLDCTTESIRLSAVVNRFFAKTEICQFHMALKSNFEERQTSKYMSLYLEHREGYFPV